MVEEPSFERDHVLRDSLVGDCDSLPLDGGMSSSRHILPHHAVRASDGT
jgi:hypothetical protein